MGKTEALRSRASVFPTPKYMLRGNINEVKHRMGKTEALQSRASVFPTTKHMLR